MTNVNNKMVIFFEGFAYWAALAAKNKKKIQMLIFRIQVTIIKVYTDF